MFKVPLLNKVQFSKFRCPEFQLSKAQKFRFPDPRSSVVRSSVIQSSIVTSSVVKCSDVFLSVGKNALETEKEV